MEDTDERKASEITETTSRAKRRLLSGLGTGSGLLGISALIPATWVKPVVNAVMLPAHAVHSPGHSESPDDPDVQPVEARGAPRLGAPEITVNSSTNATTLAISWQPPADSEAAANVDRYVVQYRKSTASEFTTVTVELSTASSGTFEQTYTLTGAMQRDQYVFQVRAAYDATDEDPASAEDDPETIATGVATVPEIRGAPVITSFVFSNNSLGAMNTDGVTVVWTAPTDAAAAANVDQYIVRYRRSAPNPETEFRPLENFDANLFAPDASLRKRFVLGSNSPDLTSDGVVITGRSFLVQVEAVYNDAAGNQEEAGMYIATDTVGPYDPSQ